MTDDKGKVILTYDGPKQKKSNRIDSNFNGLRVLKTFQNEQKQKCNNQIFGKRVKNLSLNSAKQSQREAKKRRKNNVFQFYTTKGTLGVLFKFCHVHVLRKIEYIYKNITSTYRNIEKPEFMYMNCITI